MPKLFQHEGCLSGQCIFHQFGMACVFEDSITDPKNGAMEKRKKQELKQEMFRLLTEYEEHHGK